MAIGFTGTQRGMTDAQRVSFEAGLRFMLDGSDKIFRHGDCIGADAEAHEIAVKLGYQVVIHPPVDPKKRAWCKDAIRIEVPKPYIERNHDIVDASHILLATPGEPTEQLRSGTWATIRYARKTGRKLLIISPEGLPL